MLRRLVNFESGDYFIGVSITSGRIVEGYQFSGFVSPIPTAYVGYLPTDYTPWYELPSIGDTPATEHLVDDSTGVFNPIVIAETDVVYARDFLSLYYGGNQGSLLNNGHFEVGWDIHK